MRAVPGRKRASLEGPFKRAVGDQSALIPVNGAKARRPVGTEPLGRQIYLVTPASLSAARQSISQNAYIEDSSYEGPGGTRLALMQTSEQHTNAMKEEAPYGHQHK